MLEILLYGLISLLLTYVLYRKGRFNKVRKLEHATLTALGMILTFVDVVETWIGYEFEGNPVVRLVVELLPRSGWIIFILYHIGIGVLVFFLGWRGRFQEEVPFRAGLAFVVTFLVILTVMNALLLMWYGMF